MSENIQSSNQKNGEIDLLDLIKSIGRAFIRFIKATGHAFIVSFVFLLRRWLPLSISIVLAIGVSFLFKATIPASYKSDLVLRNNSAGRSDIISFLNRLHIFCNEANYSALGTALSLSPQQAKNIIDIKAYWIIDKNRDGIADFVDYRNRHDIYDTIDIRMLDRLDVRVRIRSPGELPILRNGIILFINSDSLFQQRNRLKIRQNHELLVRLDNDILQLDSLQKVKYFEETRNKQPQSGGQMIFLQEQKTQLVYGDIYSLYERKQNLESERDLFSGIVTVINEFPIPLKRYNGGLYYGLFFIPCFFLFTLILLIFKENRKKLSEVFDKY